MTEQVTDKTLVYTFAGVTDEVTGCSCCGRQGLKRTIVLKPIDGSDFVYFGVTCAGRALTWATSNKPLSETTIINAARKAGTERRQADWERRRAEHPATAQLEALLAPFATLSSRERLHNAAYKALQPQLNALCAQLNAEVQY